MAKVGRNSPCLCGSGKKYKQCCLARKDAYQSLLQEQENAKIGAVEWLVGHYGEAVKNSVAKFFFQDPEGDLQERIEDLPEIKQLAVFGCLHDWLIADAELYIGKNWVRASDLLLGEGGPKFTANGRRYIEELAASTLSFYEVLEVHKGKGLLLRDMLRADEAPIFVYEVKATEALVRWDTFGGRPLLRDGKYSLAGGGYPFKRDAALELSEVILKIIKKEAKKKRPALSAEAIATYSIIKTWLTFIVTPPSIPIMIDAQTKEPILFTTDQYRVSDWRALEDILTAQENVDQVEDKVWVWIEPIDEERFRHLARLERLQNGILAMECRTKGKADTARKWLESLARPYLSHEGRSTADPRENLQHAYDDSPSPRKGPLKGIPLELQQEIITKYRTEHYEKWLNVPLPVLDGKTPLQAAKLKSCRPRLVELLKSIEQGESNMAKTSGIPPFDTGFLWERLGLEPE